DGSTMGGGTLVSFVTTNISTTNSGALGWRTKFGPTDFGTLCRTTSSNSARSVSACVQKTRTDTLVVPTSLAPSGGRILKSEQDGSLDMSRTGIAWIVY